MTFTRTMLHPPLVRTALIAVTLLGLCAGGAPVLASNQDPMTVVKDTIGQVLIILKNPEYRGASEAKRQKLRDAVEGHFDWNEMSRSALGYHWRNLSGADREKFCELFKRFMEASYIGKIESYSGQQINYVHVTPDGPGYSTVYTTIVQTSGDPIKVNYTMRQEGGDCKVSDVTIDGISIVANYRNQFNRVINNRGLPALLDDLKRKQAQIEAGS